MGSSKLARNKPQLNVIRYADDFVVTGALKEVLESKVVPAIWQFLTARGLNPSEWKTRITHIAEGFDFLGQNLRSERPVSPLCRGWVVRDSVHQG